MKLLAHCLLPISLVSGNIATAVAQTDSTKLVCYFPPVPELVGSSSSRAIAAAIYQRIIFSPECRRAQVIGRVFVTLTITPAGNVERVIVVKSLWAPFDSAVVQAARQLPRFKPRHEENGVTGITVPISFEEAALLAARQFRYPAAHRTTPRRNSTR